MASWYLNRFLTTWRDAVNRRFNKRARTSDGSIGNAKHAASSSQHNPDRDGSVDAWDMDVNLLGLSHHPTGSKTELVHIEDLKREFQNLPQAQLWIHKGQIANRDIGNWRRRKYTGSNPHDKHVHWQSRSSREDVAFKGDVLSEQDEVVDAVNQPRRLESKSVPKWPIAPERHFAPYLSGAPYYKTVERAQRRLRERGWKITVDGRFGPQTERVIRAFQKQKRLKVDGLLGPKTWHALWAAPITDD